jgi:MFS superfamily sulfate permease-like transporter
MPDILISGFMAGVGIIIVGSQIPYIFGLNHHLVQSSHLGVLAENLPAIYNRSSDLNFN